jgi:transposase
MDLKPPLPPAVWERTPVEAPAYLRGLDARVAVLAALVQRVQATLQHLTERLPQDARPSSPPPASAPPPATATRPRREPGGRRPGGPPGHEGQARALMPGDPVAVVMPVKPERCPHCQPAWHGEAPQPQRQQGPTIPPVRLVITA